MPNLITTEICEECGLPEPLYDTMETIKDSPGARKLPMIIDELDMCHCTTFPSRSLLCS